MRTALLCSFILLLCTCVRAQCPASLVINTNQDVVNFRATYPECTQLPGSLTIKGQTITDLSPLSVLTSIGGDLLIDDLNVTGITGLENITTVNGNVTLSNCPRLERDGFPQGLKIDRIDGFLSLDNLPRLTEFIPLNDLNILSSGFGTESAAVGNLAPLSNLSGNMARLEITDNPNLTDLSALDGVALIDVMVITGNTVLSDCAIAPICAALGAGNSATISGNRGDCNSAPLVVQQCLQSCTTPDFDALEAIYNAANGASWTDNTGWLTNCDYCTWFGVTCNQDGRVTGLALADNGLTGTIAPEVNDLVSLQTLKLNTNALSGGIPDLSGLSQLSSLELYNNNLSGGLPALGAKPDLTLVHLVNNELTGPIPAAYNATNLRAIQRLFLSGNQLSGELPAELGGLTTLDRLHLFDNDLSGCYPSSYRDLCDITSILFNGNTGLPDGGSAGWFAEEFCMDGRLCDNCQLPDYEVLSQLYTQTNGDNWTNNTGWLTDCDFCEWFGVDCNADGRVTAINLIDNNLVGTVPDVMDQLEDLVSINLSGSNGLTGAVPASLFELGAITNIVLVDNDFTGGLPGNIDQPITLRVLQLDNNENLGGTLLPGLFDLVNLERLTLSACGFTGPIPAAIGELTELDVLRLGGNELTGTVPAELRDLADLTELHLPGNNLNGELPVELADLSNLTSLLLNDNQLTGCYPLAYSQLCGISQISFSGNDELPDGGSADFFENNFCANGQACEQVCSPDFDALMALYTSTGGANWTNNTGWAEGAAGTDCDVCDWEGITCNSNGRVITINLGNNNLTGTIPNEIGQLTELDRLALSSNSLSGPIPSVIGSLSKLRRISLNDNALTGGIPPELGMLPNALVFNLYNNNLGGTIPPELGNATTLTNLDIRNNGLTGQPPATLRQLVNLTNFSIGNNELTGPLFKLDNQPDLQQYGAAFNLFSGPIPEDLVNSTVISNISLSGNPITGPLPELFGNLPALTSLLISGAQLSGCYPANYSNLCGDNTNFTNNPGLPDGGSDNFFENTFCATGQTCEEACPTDLTINTDQDLADFRAQYPNCTMLPGNLTLDGAGITATNQLDVLEGVGGNFEIRNLNLTTIRGITNILTIGGDFIVEDCPNLGTNGFGNDLDLTSIGRDLIISDLPVIENITPLRNVTSVGRDVFIQRIAVSSLNGLQSLSGTLNGLILQDNDNLTDLTALGSDLGGRAAALTSIGSVTVLDNDALTNLAGFEGWAVNGSFTIRDNSALSDCAARNICQKIAQDDNLIFISGNAAGCGSVMEVEASCSSALPVEWEYFTATSRAKRVELAWATSAEADNEHFEVERSGDGVAWTTIGRVGAGETYVYKDTAPLNGDNYYRLRQVDYGGAFTFSEVRRVSFSGTPVAAWPNPFRAELNLFSTEPDLITVYDINGRALRRIEHAGGGAQVQRMGLEQGVYLLRFQRSGEVVRIVAE